MTYPQALSLVLAVRLVAGAAYGFCNSSGDTLLVKHAGMNGAKRKPVVGRRLTRHQHFRA